MIETASGLWRKKATGKFMFQRNGESTFVDMGNVRMHTLDAKIDRTSYTVARKGYNQTVYEEPSLVERRWKIGLDEELPDLVRLDLLAGTHTIVDQEADEDQDESFTSVKKGGIIVLAKQNVSNVAVKVATVAKVEGTDYEIDLAAGIITILRGGSIADAATVDVTYDFGDAALIQHVSESELTCQGSFVFDEYDTNSELPRARYTGPGMLIMSKRADQDGKKYGEFEVELLVTGKITRVSRVD